MSWEVDDVTLNDPAWMEFAAWYWKAVLVILTSAAVLSEVLSRVLRRH